MPIHTQDYRHWEGTLKPHNPMRWCVITKAELKLLAQRKFVRLIVAIPPIIYVLVHAVLIYIVNQIPGTADVFKVDAEGFQRFLFLIPLTPLLIALIVIFGGSGLIANDLKNNSLSLYLSKPISWIDYLIGKFAVVGILLACLTLVPGILLFFEHVLLTDISFFEENYWVLLSIIAYSTIIIVPASLLILVFSSLTSNPRYATIGFCAVWFGTYVVFEILRTFLHDSKMAWVSIWTSYDRLGTALFGISSNYSVPWFWSLFTIVVLMLFCVFILRHRIRAVEIVK